MSLRSWARRIAPWIFCAGIAFASPVSVASEFDLLLFDGFEECPVAYPDADGDGFGAAFGVAHRCDPLPAGFVRVGGDCADGNDQINISVTENEPDAAFADENCDGVDGDVDLAVFVRVGGASSLPCGTRATPCALSIAHFAAMAAGKVQLYLATGNHQGPLELSGGGSNLRVFGGYSNLFRSRAPVSPEASTQILGATLAAFGAYAVQASNGALLNLTDLRLVSPDATSLTPGGDAQSSYGARVFSGAVLTTVRAEIHAGNGATGMTGTAGSSAQQIAAQSVMHGGVGGSGAEFVTACNSSSHGGGGAAGTNSCAISPSSRAMNGGGGGNGGEMDTDCNIFSLDTNATPGDNGVSAAFVSGSAGLRGLGGSGGDACGPTTGGGDGLAVNGNGGNGNPGFSILAGSLVIANSGGAGGTGDNGSGGGGGGGGGGCDDGTDAYGAGGGGGGAGGCAARTGGSGGRGGGASIGIAVFSATLVMTDTRITTGAGGNGGSGGAGGTGQAPGLGQAGGLFPGTAMPGRGGDGAPGGHSGGGSGGTGGSSLGVLRFASNVSGTPIVTLGTRGTGGAGGISAFPPGTGDVGSVGDLAAQRTCFSVSNC